MDKSKESRAILLNLSDINRKLIMNKQNFKTWDAYQEYFGEVLNLGILKVEDAISFSWSLYSSIIIPYTTREQQEINNKKSGIKSFIKKASSNEYRSTHNITKDNIGTLYSEEMMGVINPKQEVNNNNNSKRSLNN